jgi:hypothetical protein
VAARHLLEFAIKTWSATSYVVTEYGDEAEMVGVTRNDGTEIGKRYRRNLWSP